MEPLEGVQRNVQLSDYTTIKLGGPTTYVYEAHTDADLVSALRWAIKEDVPVLVLGGGSNSILPDEGFDGLVIFIRTKGIEFQNDGLVRVAAGEVWDEFIQSTITKGLAGLECLSGIPGLVGATPMQNVGAYGQEVAEVIVKVHALDRTTLQEVEFSPDECKFGYRTSRFKTADRDKYVITKVVFRLQPDGTPTTKYPQVQEMIDKTLGTDVGSGSEALQKVRDIVLDLRRKKSMVVQSDDPHSRSCGSFFTNALIAESQFEALKAGYATIPSFPAGEYIKIPAAWLIEQSGFKRGYTENNVGISPNHALALVNYGGTTKDLLHLADKIQAAVKQKFGITLAIEPDILTT